MRLLLAVLALASPWSAAAEAVELSVLDIVDPPARASIAHANRFWLGVLGEGAAVERMAVELRDHDTGTLADVRLRVTATGTGRDVRVPIEIPRGARVTAAAVSIGTQPREVASAMGARNASRTYALDVQAARDPILVEWTRENVAGDEIEVRVFPLGAKAPATIELTIELPPARAFEVDPGDTTIGRLEIATTKRTAWRRVETPKRVALAPRELAFVAVTDRPFVNAAVSLYGAPARPAVVIPWCCKTAHDSSLGSREIRRYVKNYRARLGRCYTRVVEYEGGLEGDAVLHFTILASGKVADVAVDGDLDDERVTRCLADEVARWELRAGDGVVRVNYPLRFRLARPARQGSLASQ